MKSSFDIEKFGEDLKRLALYEGRTGVEELMHQMALLIRDLLRIIAPTGKHALTESFKVQRDIGVAAVKRNIAKVWRSAASAISHLEAWNANAAKQWKKYIRTGNVEAIKTMQTRMHSANPDFVVLAVDEAMHDKSRNPTTGRAIGTQTLVLRGNSIKQLVRTKVSHVGQAKGGLSFAAGRLGVTIPEWIKGKGNPGTYEPDLAGDKKSITVRNLVSYIGNLVSARQLNNALLIRQRSMEQRLAYKMRSPKRLT